MKIQNKYLKKLLFPPIWVLLLLTAVSAAALVAVFVKGMEEHPVAYMVYVLSFYTLSVDSLFCALVLPGVYRAAKEKVYGNRIGNRYMTDKVFRTHVNLYASLGVNLLYVGVHVLSWALYRSAWFWILAVYYGILAVMRFLVLRYINRNKVGTDLAGEWRRARLCSWILILINLVLTGAVLMILYQRKGMAYHGMLIYVMAAYTFYMATNAIINIFKYRKLGSPILSTAKIISLTSAMVSMLSLETAMFAAFGADTPAMTKNILIIATGAGISVVVMVMAIYMLWRSKKELKKEIMDG